MKDILCPKCNEFFKPESSWDFLDGEEHAIKCSCGKKFVIKIDRPIVYYILEKK
ncbi:MAG: hypothetical protein HQL27_05610 [Candidatus Omnitrophica bacterium]|nr:hypothetical protein [Candidatus Omnitrophota bacterium]